MKNASRARVWLNTQKTKKYLPSEMYESWGGLFMPKRYEVLNKQTWVTCKTAKLVNNTQLHYMLYDGTQGVAEKGRWRVKGEINPPAWLLTNSKPENHVIQTEQYDPDDNILEI